VIARVAALSYAEVLCDTQLKSFACMLTSANLSQTSLASVLCCTLFLVGNERIGKPYLYNFDKCTWIVVLSLVTRALLTPSLQKVLDSIRMNTEAADILEMLFMGARGGGAYHSPLQSKLLFTAVTMKCAKGSNHSKLQRNALLAVTFVVITFVIMDSGGDSGCMVMLGAASVLAQVVLFCYVAVLSDTLLKDLASMSTLAKLSQWSLARGLCPSLLLVGIERTGKPYWYNFDMYTWIVVLPSIAKPLMLSMGAVLGGVHKALLQSKLSIATDMMKHEKRHQPL